MYMEMEEPEMRLPTESMGRNERVERFFEGQGGVGGVVSGPVGVINRQSIGFPDDSAGAQPTATVRGARPDAGRVGISFMRVRSSSYM